MADASVSKKKRPERQLYVPPAQRSRVPRGRQEKIRKQKSSDAIIPSGLAGQTGNCTSETVLTLGDTISALYNLNTIPLRTNVMASSLGSSHSECEFQKYLQYKNDRYSKYTRTIPFYKNSSSLKHHHDITVITTDKHRTEGATGLPFPLFHIGPNDELSDFATKRFALLQSEGYRCDWDLSSLEHSLVYKIVCDKSKSDFNDFDVVDLASLGHYIIVSINDCEYFFECQEEHDARTCCINKLREVQTLQQVEKIERIEKTKQVETAQQIEQIEKATPERTLQIDKPEQIEETVTFRSSGDLIKNELNSSREKSKSKLKTKAKTNEHDQEKEIMRKTKENMNRKTRPIMRYVEDANDTLRIEQADSLNNWEDLFDDNGQIQEEFLTEIVDKVGDDITIITASEDYSEYTTKPIEALEHVVELYNFPSTLGTHDLIQAFSDIKSDSMYVKWVDDTHALLVLGSSTQAQKAVTMANAIIKVRPMTAASSLSMEVANKSDLKPAMRRPATSLHTARRLITSHLGTKSRITKEQIAKEKQDLKEARELRRLCKQSERDAWEGNLRSSVK